jgi:transcriptional regulator with XRE-family HTH domain
LGPVPGGWTEAGAMQASPTLSRLMIGVALRRLREARGITREAACQAIRASESKISRLELGRSGVKLRDVADLCTLYGVTDHTERATLLGLARLANSPEWWYPYRDLIPGWFEPYEEPQTVTSRLPPADPGASARSSSPPCRHRRAHHRRGRALHGRASSASRAGAAG